MALHTKCNLRRRLKIDFRRILFCLPVCSEILCRLAFAPNADVNREPARAIKKESETRASDAPEKKRIRKHTHTDSS